MKLVVMVTSTVGSMIGWWIGAPFGLFTAFVFSIVGVALGIWGGRRLGRSWGLD